MRGVASAAIGLCIGCSAPVPGLSDAGTDGGTDGGFVETLSRAVCVTDGGPFSTELDNPFLPFVIGSVHTLEGDAGTSVTATAATVGTAFEVLQDTEQVAGVTTRVVRETRSADGVPVEVTRNLVVAAPDGTVCFFGEDVGQLDGGVVVSTVGTWRAGVNGAAPGILMPAVPSVGQAYLQKSAPGVAEVQARNTAVGEVVETPAGTFTDTLTVEETSPLTPGISTVKVYARGVGVVSEDGQKLLLQTP